VRVAFENAEEVREVRLEHADIVRQPLIRGTLVEVQRGEEVRQGEIVEVDWPDSPRELCAYTVRIEGSEEPVFESQVTPRSPASSDPRDQFAALHWRGPFRFFSRWDMHRTISRWYEDSEGIPTAIGARIEPAVHHVHALRSALWDTNTRHLLADDDPEARLFEAAMVAQYTLADDPDARVLIVAPGGRTHRWQSALEIRFGGRDFVRVSEGHLAVNPRERWASIAQNQRLIMSASCLQRHADACGEMLLDADWDLVIFDDAHLFDPYDPAYDCLRTLSLDADRLLVLAALPAEPDEDALGALLALLDPTTYGEGGDDEVASRLERLAPIWKDLVALEPIIEKLDETDVDQLSEGAAPLVERLDDDYVAECAEAIESSDGESLVELADYVGRFYRLDPRIVRSRRERLADHGVAWRDRTHEIVEYDADEAEKELVDAIDAFADAEVHDPVQLALLGAYRAAATSSPDRLFQMLEERLDALDTTAGRDELDPQLLDLHSLEPGPIERELFEEQLITSAPELDGEGALVAEAMSLVGQWHADAQVACARFEAAASWIEDFFEENRVDEGDEPDAELPPAPAVLVCCAHRASVEEFTYFLEGELEGASVHMAHAGAERGLLDEAVESFRGADLPRVLVCDEAGTAGRDISFVDALVHLEQPRTLGRIQRRLSWIDRPHRASDHPIHSVSLVGPSPVERALVELGGSVGVFQASAAQAEYEIADLDRRLWPAAARGVEDVSEFDASVLSLTAGDQQEEARAYRRSLDPPRKRLADDAEFAELLDFIDGVADSLPIRHWARMLGIQDEPATAGVHEFKWHWSKVRRPLPGFDIDPEDVDLLMPEEQVGMVAGTFERRRALRSESLEFLAPGHRFVDALVEDSLGPTDGRATIFARRLGPQHRGEMFLNVVASTRLEPQAWDELEMPRGLLTRAYRRLWPESISVPVEFDLRGDLTPTLVEDWDLIQKIEQSYQGPEADQKIEYEIFLQAIEDAARFRRVLDEAIEVAVEHLESQRGALVEGAVDELLADLRPELAYHRMREGRGVSDASVEVVLREKLVDSLRRERLELDALAIVVAGTPQVLVR
ncbi:MAG: hypothetical protein ACOCV2_11205, partial [Persicimonas sp.]